MSFKNLQRGVFATGAFVSLGFALTISSQPQPDGALSSSQSSQAIPVRPGTPVAELETSSPTSIQIDSINVKASVTAVGVDEDFQFQVPRAEQVGWYKYSSVPGLEGSSVLAAHVDFNGEQGVFFNLSELKKGDTFSIEMDDGTSMNYRVVDNVRYDKNSLPVDELFAKDGASTLRLVTCGGKFDPQTRSYTDNLVVTAVPISEGNIAFLA